METMKKLAQSKTLEQLSEDLQAVQIALYNFKKQEQAIKDEILNMYEVKLGLAYINKDEPFGTVNFEDDGIKVSFNTPKKVHWDQEKLAELYKEAGPDYIDIDYHVSEAKYKLWNKEIKEALLPARTVEPGTITVKVEKLK